MTQLRYKHYFNLFLLFSALITFNGCLYSKHLTADSKQQKNSPQEEIYAVINVNIIPMKTEGEIIKNATVVIKNKKILSINKPIPANAKLINGENKWLVPGLIDMHVHNLADANLGSNYPTKGPSVFINTQDFMLLYVANGVTTTFELSGRAEHFGQRDEIIKGNVIGPRIALALLIDGGDAPGIVANTPSDGRQTVRMAKAEGYDFIKVYSKLNIETYKAIVDEANKQGMKVVGHIPNAFKGRTEEAFVPGFDMVAHAEEFSKQIDDYTDEQAKRFAQLAKRNGTWLMPTLVTMVRIAEQVRSLDAIRNLPDLKYVHPLIQSKWLTANNYSSNSSPERIAYFEKLIDFHVRLVKSFKEAGVPIVAGTDAGTSGVVWGFSLPDEIELLVKAGLTPQEALISSTRLPATWLGIEDKVGTIEAGKYADLILLDANPLDNISNIRKIAGVFVNGQWVSKERIDDMLSGLAKKNDADKDKYDWKKRKEY